MVKPETPNRSDTLIARRGSAVGWATGTRALLSPRQADFFSFGCVVAGCRDDTCVVSTGMN